MEGFRAAIDSALIGIQERAGSHRWSAVIGELPTMWAGQSKRLTERISLADIKVRSSDMYFFQPGFMPIKSASVWSTHVSVPLLVRGVSSGYDWMHAQADAAKKIGTLISFLSLVWNVPVEVQESPAPLEWGERLPQDRPAWVKEDAFTHHEYPDMADLPPFELPDWMESGWILLNRRAKLQRALSIYMEGVRIQDKHPSLALVSFVAAVESISLMLFHEQKCSTCPNHINIGEKFRATLELVVAGGELESLRAVYGNRSRTVHEGRLHGAEVSPGFISFSLFGGGSSDAVVRGSLLGMGNAARKLLIMAVRGQLPGISHFRKE